LQNENRVYVISNGYNKGIAKKDFFSIEFDKDGEYFILAGVAKRIKVYEFQSVIENTDTLHYPVTQLQCTSKIRSLYFFSFSAFFHHCSLVLVAVCLRKFNNDNLFPVMCHGIPIVKTLLQAVITMEQYNFGIPHLQNQLGVIRSAFCTGNIAFYEHEKRCWTVVFNSVDPHLMASGSDDARVKLWSIGVDRSVATIDAKVNVCCVCFSPTQRNYLVFGSAERLGNCFTTFEDLFVPYWFFNSVGISSIATDYVIYIKLNSYKSLIYHRSLHSLVRYPKTDRTG
uniref:WD_REPEATS_REGION domain-containing protein n=1 Tax=Brugia timori TaxID=42155 RepID=A0A0R3QEG3_9BILA